MPIAQRQAPTWREPAYAVPRLPHPSWDRSVQPRERPTLKSASEFWNRLGL